MLAIFTKNDFVVGTTDYDRIEDLTRPAYEAVLKLPFALSYVDGQLKVLKNSKQGFGEKFKVASLVAGVDPILKQIDEAEKHNEISGFGVM